MSAPENLAEIVQKIQEALTRVSSQSSEFKPRAVVRTYRTRIPKVPTSESARNNNSAP